MSQGNLNAPEILNRVAEQLPAPALERGLQILEVLAESKHGLTLSQISLRFGYGKSTAFRLLRTLRETGYIYCEKESNRYFPSSKLSTLGKSAYRHFRIHSRSIPYLNELREMSALTVQLAVLDDREVVIVENLKMNNGRFSGWLGKRLAMHSTSMGKAILAYLDDVELSEIQRSYGMQQYNASTIVSSETLKKHLQGIRHRGFAFENEESEIGVRSIAAPIFDLDENVVAAVSVTGTVSQITSENMERLAELVKDTASKIASNASLPGN